VEANKQLSDQLRERTIERDHFKEDSLLWSLVVAKFVDDEGGELVVRRDEINAYMGRDARGEGRRRLAARHARRAAGALAPEADA
jgi:hypothetical protein